jgi:hypothetical protein
MKRTPIKRRTPMPRSKLQMKRTPIRKVSVRRESENRTYLKLNREYLAEHRFCECCEPIHGGPVRRSNQVHHYRGRVGRLLTDTRFFRASCQECHTWICDNGAEARKRGVLAPVAEFNVYPQ